ncbi:MAG: nucleotidyltransferase domain-containing protein [Chloroflexi bacterium]|nr:nucleotidyltransferase domain-containing protein [Chloroflexota bacterium]MCI0579602.1 nucleotidyltransferase domain-containing protein [Chloroflexota bacterium]MCI0644837.1 nucleotidyltransferase domain-containing protein [Chloroflexota bacterium]MCI0731437.1 nucleotidyltransferase domain-containing protein [Chloroflexota bacterium]
MFNVDWQALERVFTARPNVIAAWVFGSAQKGQVAGGSDLDVGVLFIRRPWL